jgi:hypothetical protein
MLTVKGKTTKISRVTGRLRTNEITPTMISAGELALSEYDPEMEKPEDAVCRIFRAMMHAKKT